MCLNRAIIKKFLCVIHKKNSSVKNKIEEKEIDDNWIKD